LKAENANLPKQVDLVIIGSGAGGLTAALTASLAGLKVLVLEHAAQIGGTSARSSGTVWIPDNQHMHDLGITDDGKIAAQYLKALIGEHAPDDLGNRFLENAPEMLVELEKTAGIRFRPYLSAPDYRQDCPGAANGGRALEPMPFDGRQLKQDFNRLAWPLPELMLFGKMMVTRAEAIKLLRADRSWSGFRLGIRLMLRYWIDRLSYPRGTRLVLGNALVARLLKALLDREVPVLTGVYCRKLMTRDGRVTGIEVEPGHHSHTVLVSKGVILAGGGFPANAEWRELYLPGPVAEHTPASQGCDGSTMRLALGIGASLGPAGEDNALWFPSSIARRSDGSTAVYPHIVLDRSKPGLIAVNQQGRRFVNEAVSYHEFVRGMYRAHKDASTIPAYLICDRSFIRRYGLGLIRPRTPFLGKYIKSGYLTEADSLEELAMHIDVPPANLLETVARYNQLVESGHDDDFNKGDNIYDRSNGDNEVAPNPCLGPVQGKRFYALPVYPTPLGTSLGLRADVNARVCRADGQVIGGLYVCGNDMQSAFCGEYPGAGAQLGQAMTFAWIAARHAAGTLGDTARHRDGNSFTNIED